jgi:protein-S-isoprenylcysteine O-methyltransferase Ste14
VGNDVALSCRPVPRAPRPSRPAPPPLQVDTAKVVLAGTAAWAVALVVLLLLGDRVDPVWKWTCVCGIVLAGLGLALMRWQGQLRPRSRPDDDGAA